MLFQEILLLILYHISTIYRMEKLGNCRLCTRCRLFQECSTESFRSNSLDCLVSHLCLEINISLREYTNRTFKRLCFLRKIHIENICIRKINLYKSICTFTDNLNITCSNFTQVNTCIDDSFYRHNHLIIKENLLNLTKYLKPQQRVRKIFL